MKTGKGDEPAQCLPFKGGVWVTWSDMVSGMLIRTHLIIT